MENLRADIAKFLEGLLVTILGFLGKDTELSEEQVASIKSFVDAIFLA